MDSPLRREIKLSPFALEELRLQLRLSSRKLSRMSGG